MSRAYYNEVDPKAVAWLRELIARGLIAAGDVDERSIEDVRRKARVPLASTAFDQVARGKSGTEPKPCAATCNSGRFAIARFSRVQAYAQHLALGSRRTTHKILERSGYDDGIGSSSTPEAAFPLTDGDIALFDQDFAYGIPWLSGQLGPCGIQLSKAFFGLRLSSRKTLRRIPGTTSACLCPLARSSNDRRHRTSASRSGCQIAGTCIPNRSDRKADFSYGNYPISYGGQSMSSWAYYNDNDPRICAWVRELMKHGHIMPGYVDERSIEDVRPDDLRDFVQVHMFCGIGGWSRALRIAGWPDSRPVWTGSCPCQPFSAAGKGEGVKDERHLWPVWFRLIRACRPAVVFGEQVASAMSVGRARPLLPEMRDQQAILGVLRELQRESSRYMQGLREGFGARKEGGEPEGQERTVPQMADGKSRGSSCPSREASSEGEGNPVRSGSTGYPREDQCGDMRADRDQLQFDRASRVERSVTRSDCSWRRVYQEQHEGSSLCPERDGEYLGPESHRGDSWCDHEKASRRIEQLVSSLGGSAQGSAEQAWIDSVYTDMEGAGYTVGHHVLGAHSVGAPHIRQRVWFVANADRRGCGTGRKLAVVDEVPERTAVVGVQTEKSGSLSRLADADGGHACTEGLQRGRQHGQQSKDCSAVPLGDTSGEGLPLGSLSADGGRIVRIEGAAACEAEPLRGFWSGADWIACRDGKWRPVSASPQPMVDGLPESLGRVCDSVVAEIEAEIAAYAEARKTSCAEELRNLCEALNEKAQRGWSPRGLPDIQAPSFLLAFVCQLAAQGWRVAQGLPLCGPQAPRADMRMLWDNEASARASRKRGLEGQSARERADALHFLSPILARHAQTAWGIAHQAYAETAFPLGRDLPARVVRLRGYGNAIVPEVAAEFIQAAIECGVGHELVEVAEAA